MFTKRVRKLAAFIVSFAMVTGILPLNMVPKGFGIIPERAEAAETVGDFTIEGDTGYSYAGNVLTIGGSGEYTVAMASVGTTTNTDTIRVTSTEDVTITLDSVIIENDSRSPFEIDATGDVTLKLRGESKFTVTEDDYAGLQKTSTDNELIITSAAGDGSTEGKLTATGNDAGAGIGGGDYGNGSNITITGGIVEATSENGAGIGGGLSGNGSNIRISGGEVTARSEQGAGIGGGYSGAGSNITIEGIEGLYDSIDNLGDGDHKLAAGTIKSGLSADENYRLANDTTDEPLWSDGNNSYTSEQLAGNTFTGNAEYTAVSVRQYTVKFVADDNGSITGEAEYLVDEGKSITDIPEIEANDYYSFKNWDIEGTDYTTDELKTVVINGDTTVTAEFEPSKYSISFAESSVGEFGNISGVEDGKATYLTDVSFTFTPNENYRIESVYYTVNGEGQNDIVDNGDGNYTIPGTSIRGDISVTVETQETRTFVFATAAGENRGSLSGTTSFIIDMGEYITAEQLENVIINETPGYSFTGWMVDDTISGQAVVVPAEVPADRDITFYAQFGYTDFDVTDNNNAANIISGLENGYAHLNTDIEFEIKDSIAVTYVGYSIGDGEAVKLTADDEGNYTVPGSVITGDVTIVTNVVPGGGFTFISKADYMGEAINAFDDNRKIAVLDADELERGNYALTNGREFFWSDRYGAYVMIVDAGETAKTMNAKLTVNENGTLRPVDYSGDLNGTGVVTAGDGGMLNDILGNTWSYVVTDSQLFMLDVEGNNGDEGYQKAMTSDIVWILKESLGLNDNE